MQVLHSIRFPAEFAATWAFLNYFIMRTQKNNVVQLNNTLTENPLQVKNGEEKEPEIIGERRSSAQIFKSVWGIDIEEAYWHILDVFKIVGSSSKATENLLYMLTQAIDNNDFSVDCLITFDEVTKSIRGVSALVYYAFYNSGRWESRSPFIERNELVLKNNSPEFYIDSVFDSIVGIADVDNWNKAFRLLLSNHLSPSNVTKIERKQLADCCCFINSMNKFLYDLEIKALPGIKKYFEDK